MREGGKAGHFPLLENGGLMLVGLPPRRCGAACLNGRDVALWYLHPAAKYEVENNLEFKSAVIWRTASL